MRNYRSPPGRGLPPILQNFPHLAVGGMLVDSHGWCNILPATHAHTCTYAGDPHWAARERGAAVSAANA